MNYVFFGNNVPLAERLRKALGTGVIECITLLQMKNTLLPAEEMDYCVFIEKTDPTLNIPAIMPLPYLYHHGDLDQAGGQRPRFLQVETSRQQL